MICFLLRQSGAATDVAAADGTIGLSGGLTFDSLRLEAVGCNTAIRLTDSGQVLAVVNSVKPEQLLLSFVTANITLI